MTDEVELLAGLDGQDPSFATGARGLASCIDQVERAQPPCWVSGARHDPQ